MSKIWVKGRLSARAGGKAEFEKWAEELVEKIRTSDPGTLAFGVYPDGADGDYIIYELYEDSQAAIGHLQNVGPLLERMGDVVEPPSHPIEVFGDVSDELRSLYSAWNAKIYPPVQSF